MRYTPEFGTQVRTGIGELIFGRNRLYTTESVVPMTAGKPGTARADGNALTLFIQGVYMQSVARTTGELTRRGFELTKCYQSVTE